MGTDVYLIWEGMSETDKRNQFMGFSIEAGNVGYLRASMGMGAENEVLEWIFPKKCWDGEDVAYDFQANSALICPILRNYLDGIPLPKRVWMDSPAESIDVDLTAFADSLNSDEPIPRNYDRVDWAKSLLDFFALGMRLQREGKKPSVYISY